MDLLLFQLDKQLVKPLYEQLYEGIRQAIINQQLKLGTKLPSKRQLAEFFDVSQTTVELAYAQLLAEGYIASKPRIGYFVEEIDALPYVQTKTLPVIEPTIQNKITYDFSPGNIDEQSFPFDIWRKYAKELLDRRYEHLLQTGERQGELALRTEIAHYLLQSRGIRCLPEQIVVGSGTEQLLPMLLNLFTNEAQIAFENPGYSPLPKNQLGKRAIPIEVDNEGLNVEQLEQSNANLVYVTPSHQFPTGAVLSATRRTQLLKWAAKKPERYIIEDDYDSEFRYIGKPIPALQALDPNEKVIYLSTFTKSLMPSLRVAYFVLPAALLQAYNQSFHYYSSTVPRFEQHLLANFMRDGHFSKHLNRMRKIYRKKHDKLNDVFKTYYPQITVSGDSAGMHSLINFSHSLDELSLASIARQNGIYVLPLQNYYFKKESRLQVTFLIGFGKIKFEQIEEAIDQLMTCWSINKKNTV